MCTVTIVPFREKGSAGLRMACNRDESPLRPAALPPQVRPFGARTGLMPVDPNSDGTWIGVNDAGLVMTLLNRYVGDARVPRDPLLPSRGTIIPALLQCDNLPAARAMAQEWLRRPFAPFRLILADVRALVALSLDPGNLQVLERPLDKPLLFTSSGLGDDLVEVPRRALFEQFGFAHLPLPADWRELQDAYHRHSWPDQQHLSVCMRRANARTVSYTTVEIAQGRATMRYSPRPPDEAGAMTELGIDMLAPSDSERNRAEFNS